tara:strand:+ start:1648 stop:1893 length:246 start_codon:yes stop_codon:yes gene_type:complete
MPVMQTIDNNSKRQIEDLQLQVAHLLSEQKRDNVSLLALLDRVSDLKAEVNSLIDIVKEAEELIDYLKGRNTFLERKLKDE